MSRPCIDFIYAQCLPWKQAALGPARADVSAKILSHDPASGEMSAIVRYPAGWERPEPEALAVEEEFFVLEGTLNVNGRSYRRDTYGCFPKGYMRQSAMSEAGCDVLTFYSGRPELSLVAYAVSDISGLIEYIDLYEIPWDTQWADPSLAWMDPRRKVLRWDHDLGQVATVVFAKPPHVHPDGWSSPMLSHPCAEETFVLAGELVGERGAARVGAYSWRPAGTPHGTQGSRTGGISLARMCHGPLANNWDGDALAPFSFDTVYSPVVPADLVTVATDYVGLDRY
ncbi:cupin domain-containing protein [Sphingobium fluviale]|uniref:ChrR-like cupin domain-containing protein n=1 Tax=Sphingobium fluviale TaxID=2506423 RepID=A0A4V1N3J0_9SPHN|nr:hypothetical protein [Sphingobium fluviale]RXR28836.1 hypothetical protein EQG66_08980 [Sphingobium fluviale]